MRKKTWLKRSGSEKYIDNKSEYDLRISKFSSFFKKNKFNV